MSPASGPSASLDGPLVDRLRAHLSKISTLEEKRMFGGLTFMVDGHMCCGVLGDRLVLRLGREGVERSSRRPHTAPMDFTGRVSRTMVFVERPGWESASSLADWVDQAVDFVSTLPRKEDSGSR